MDFLAQITAQLQANSARQELNDLCKDRNVNVRLKVDDRELKNALTGTFNARTTAKTGTTIGNQIGQNIGKNIFKGVKNTVNGESVIDTIFKTSDLKDNAYMTKVSKTIDKQMVEIQKMANAKGWKNFQVTGSEMADGYIKSLRLMVTEANGTEKELNFIRGKIEGKSKGKVINRNSLIQTDEVKITKTARQAELERINADVKQGQKEKENQNKQNIEYQKALNKEREKGIKQAQKISEDRAKEEQKIDERWQKNLWQQEENTRKQISSYFDDYSTGSIDALHKQMKTEFNDIERFEFDKKGFLQVDSIKKAEMALQEFDKSYEKIQDHFSGKNVLDNNAFLSNFEKMETASAKFKNVMSEVKIDVEPFLQIEKALENASTKLKTQDFNLQTVETDASQLDKNKYGNTKQYQTILSYINQAKEAQARLNVEIMKGDQANFEQINADLKQMNSLTQKAKSQMAKLHEPIGELDKTTASNNTLAWLKENTKASKKYGDALQEIARLQKEASDWGELDNLNKRFKNITSEAKQLGLTGKTFFGEIKESFIHIAEFTQIYGLIQNVIQEIPMKMASAVIEVDDAMTNLRMATSVTNEEAKKLMETYSDIGKELKTLGTDVATSATEWLKQGKSISEASALAKDSIILSKIGGMSSEDATKTITAVMKSYDLAESDVMGFIDQISAIDMASATDVAGLSDAFNEVAANARQAGVETEKLLSYAAVIGETTQEGMAGVGTALNAIFSRMGNIKLSRLKDFETGEDLSNVETVLRKVGIYLRDSEGQFREFDEVLDETASRFSSFSSVTQRAVANAFAGTHHANDFIVLMQNYPQVQEYMNIALSSSGESLKKFEAYTDSASGKIEGFKNAFQSLSTTTINSDMFKGIIDSGTALLNVLESIIDTLGLMPIIGATIGGISIFKNLD